MKERVMEKTPETDAIVWQDLTVPDAETLRDFYSAVVGWKHEPVDMGAYSDFNMLTGKGTVTAGVCHARGSNANLPPQWLLYVSVTDLGESIRECRSRGGQIVDGPALWGNINSV